MSIVGAGPQVSRRAERPPLLWAGGTVFDVVLGGEATGGGVALLDQEGVHGDVTPLHLHRHEAEIFYVLDGEVTAWVGEDRHRLGVGDAVHLPAGQPHALGVHSQRARILTVTAPAGFAAFVRAAGMPVDGDRPATWSFDVERIMAAAPAHDIEILGPPPTLA
ncbi:MAG: cupin domain-containing protein [Nocardioidaceae bacterium]